MNTQISVDGFTVDPADGRAWTADGTWGLVREETGELTLLDSDGMPSNHTLPDDDAAHIIRKAGVGNENLMRRWDYYATAR
jgi:hypothetical protein